MRPQPGGVETPGYGSDCLYASPTPVSLLIPKWLPLLKMVGTTLASPAAQIKTAVPCRAATLTRRRRASSTLQQSALVFYVLELIRFRERRLRLRDARPIMGELCIQSDEILLIGRDIIGCVDRNHWALSHADGAVDAFVGINRQKIRTFPKTVHRAHVHAICNLYSDT